MIGQIKYINDVFIYPDLFIVSTFREAESRIDYNEDIMVPVDVKDFPRIFVNTKNYLRKVELYTRIYNILGVFQL